MKSSFVILALVLCLVEPRLSAQESPAKPGPEIKKLSLFVGSWKLNEVDEASPFGPAGAATFDTEIQFVHNGLFVEERGTGRLAGQPNSYTIVYHYDSEAHTYRSFFYDSNGSAMHAEGTLEGNTWRSHWSQIVHGKSYKFKSSSIFSSDGKTFTYVWSYSEDGATWKPWIQGKAVKVR